MWSLFKASQLQLIKRLLCFSLCLLHKPLFARLLLIPFLNFLDQKASLLNVNAVRFADGILDLFPPGFDVCLNRPRRQNIPMYQDFNIL